MGQHRDLESLHQFEVATADDRRFSAASVLRPTVSSRSSDPPASARWRWPKSPRSRDGVNSYLSKLDGSFDAGFGYTRSSGVGQLNLDSETVFRRPWFTGRLTRRSPRRNRRRRT